MNAVNPYAPPTAAVADIDDAAAARTAPVKTWSAQGRIGRLRYVAHLTGAYMVLFVFMFLAGLVLGALNARPAVTVAMGIGGIAYFWFFVLKTIQRTHDMGWNGWMSLLALIPFVGLLWWFKRGPAGANRFGPPPPPNTLGVKILGLIMPVIAGIGILAAIALPAYQAYTVRARAAQTH